MRRCPTVVGTLLLVACRASSPDPAPPAAAVTPAASPEPTARPAPVTSGPDDSGAAATAPPDVATGRNGAVTSADPLATAAGLAVLRRGGNAIDAAIATGLALGVVHPTAGNIGGGGFIVLRMPDGTAHALDFREVAPGKATRDMFLDAKGELTPDSRLGPRAAGVPGMLAGWAHAHRKWGTLPWKDLVAPAIALARDGFVMDRFDVEDLGWGVEGARKFLAALEGDPKARPALRDAVRAFIALLQRPDGTPYQVGDTWRQPDYAATLELIAERGEGEFYRGKLARKMVAGVQKIGGIWTLKDLARYKVEERTPVTFSYHGYDLIAMPPPSAGGITLFQIFTATDALGLARLPWDSIDRVHLYVEAVRRVFADRSLAMADPAFVDLPVARMMDAAYVVQRMADVKPDRATPSSEVGSGLELHEKPETTHFSVVDGKGMAAAVTVTLNGGYGGKVQIPGTGVTLNNEMDDFTTKVGAPNLFGLVQGPHNAIAPGKRMVSSMTPTIVTQGGKVRVVCGAPGGPAITTVVSQILLQVIDHKRPLDQAIAAPRVHHQWLPDVVQHEADLPREIVAGLTARGHTLKDRGHISHANCIEIEPGGLIRAVADFGRDGGDADAY